MGTDANFHFQGITNVLKECKKCCVRQQYMLAHLYQFITEERQTVAHVCILMSYLLNIGKYLTQRHDHCLSYFNVKKKLYRSLLNCLLV